MTEIVFSPIDIPLHIFSPSNELFDRQILISKVLDEGTTQINCFGILRKGAKGAVVLFPSAQAQKVAPLNPVFHRWSWAYQFRDLNVFSISDPALYYSKIHAAWFLGRPQIDLFSELAAFLKELLARLELRESELLLYGSSMGGFGALMVAAELPGACVLAEVPQIDLRNYPIKKSIELIESSNLGGVTFSDYASRFPERIDVTSRYKRFASAPSFRIVTNRADDAYEEHIAFYSKLSKLKDSVRVLGDASILTMAQEIGHRPLETARGVQLIRSTFEEKWRSVPVEKTERDLAVTAPEDPTYRALIDLAIEKSKKLKYIRDAEEEATFNEVKSALYKAAEVNKSADWPLLKICSIVKLWTNSFNQEILSAALRALERRESLEAFIYACRGYLYNFDIEVAGARIAQLQSDCRDPQTANVGNIFTAIAAYENGDFSEYGRMIEVFKENKASDFSPYISIPVSTVFTKSEIREYVDEVNFPELIGKRLLIADAPIENAKYVISASCDERYFHEYAQYLVKSFTLTCAQESILHLSVVSGDSHKLNSLLVDWGAKNVFVSVQNIECGENIGPVASLLRFCHVPQLLKSFALPVLVLDLDAVIKRSLLEFVEKSFGEDICSRILGDGVAPWEKYTGGFALFNVTDRAIKVAEDIAFVASTMCVSTEKQWWIDQNCFEAGIRFSVRSGLRVSNVYGIRDNYCVMPVGSGEAKRHNLEKALAAVSLNSLQQSTREALKN